MEMQYLYIFMLQLTSIDSWKNKKGIANLPPQK